MKGTKIPRKSGLIWAFAFLIGLAFCALEIFDSSFEERKPAVFQNIEYSWRSFKQDLQRKYFPEQLQNSYAFQTLDLRYDHRLEFWLDTKTKTELVQKLKDYPGPFALTLDAVQLSNDEILKELYQNPNFIRPLSIQPGQPEHQEFERLLSRRFSEAPTHLTALARRIRPAHSELYSGDVFFGYGDLLIQSGTIADYETYSRGGYDEIPSLALAFAQKMRCPDWSIQKNGDLQCAGDPSFQIPRVLPISFYPQRFNQISNLQDLKASENPLIINIVDYSVVFETLHHRKFTAGEIYATVASNILNQHFPVRSNFIVFFELLFFVVVAGAGMAFALRGNLRQLLTFMFVAAVVGVSADLILFLRMGFLTRPIEEFTSLLVLGFVIFITRARFEAARTLLLEKAFSGYVNKELLQRIVSGKQNLELRGRRKELTTFLIDIVRFSKIVHDLAPDQAFEVVKRIFSLTDPIILKHGGIIDKKTGDGVFGFFGDELDGEQSEVAARQAAARAVSAAFEIQEQMRSLDLREFLKIEHPQLRIGVNTGPMIVGNAGSEVHYNYTVLGEAANFTQRLEAACPPGKVLIGSRTAEWVRNEFELEEILISVKNESEKMTGYCVVSHKEDRKNYGT